MSIMRIGGQLVRTGSGVPRKASAPVGGARTFLQPSDMTFLGHAMCDVASQYASQAIAIRYVNGERRFLIAQFAGNQYWQQDKHIYLSEYKITQPLSQTKSGAPTWTLVRRWGDWHNALMHPTPTGQIGVDEAVFWSDNGNGAFPSMFHWVDTGDDEGILWYAWQPEYPGGYQQTKFHPIGWVRLTAAEANGDVSAGNKGGPYHFKQSAANPIPDDFKDAIGGVIPIPSERQTELGNHKYISFGAHCANINQRGARGLGMWVLPEYPNMNSLPADLDPVFPDAVQIYSTGSNQPNRGMRRPNNAYVASYSAFEGNGRISTSGVITTNGAIGLSVDDAIYIPFKDGSTAADTCVVRMTTGASGGEFVPEYSSAAGVWTTCPGWACSEGAVDMSGARNVFHWTKVSPATVTPPGLWSTKWIRLRRTVAGTSGGSLLRVGYANSPTSQVLTTDYSDPMGSYNILGTEQYDPATTYGFCYSDYCLGGSWVQTSNVEGLVFFMVLGTEARWYGQGGNYAKPAFPGYGAQPKRFISTMGEGAAGNGNYQSGPNVLYFATFHPDDIAAAYGDSTKRNPSFLNPRAWYHARTEYPSLGVHDTILTSNNDWVGYPNDEIYRFATSGLHFDTVTNQLILFGSRGNGTTPYIAMWQVR